MKPADAPRYLHQLAAVVRKDLLVELRSWERLVSMGAFTVLVGVLFHYALPGPEVIDPRRVVSGPIWMTLVFAGMLGVGRTFHLEAEDGAFTGVLLSPIAKDALYFGKVLSNFILVFMIVLLVNGVFGVFFGIDYGDRLGWILGVVALGALGFVALTTIFAAVSSGTTMGESLLPVLVFPLLLPMITFGGRATERLMAGRPLDEIVGDVRLLGAFTLTALFAGAVLFRHAVEE